ncbi:hypothetical protein PoB_000051500 [Plakobranchus ocellatus]|uniref:Uncharacterized protein n=1 Tax=Plakobranchus ocellatus TaxID=259542 RepID=A0AAV3XT67_9GAST|nr:hypothetical protein PoB_000051500 [Plakobranchus ocellatus]
MNHETKQVLGIWNALADKQTSYKHTNTARRRAGLEKTVSTSAIVMLEPHASKAIVTRTPANLAGSDLPVNIVRDVNDINRERKS